jgi:cobalt-zinc-cadmium efflux system protein
MNHSHLSCPPNCSHAITPASGKLRSLWMALILIVGFACVELSVGLASHSLALLAESGHMLSDGLALGLALLATWIAQLPPSKQAPFGYRRVEILAALANGLGLLGVASWIGWESFTHLQALEATPILSLPMLITAIGGLAVNSINAALLHQGSQHDLNLRGAFLHMLADVISSVGVIIAAIMIWQWGWTWADGAISLGVAVLIATGAVPLIRQSLHILLEKAPSHLDVEQIAAHLKGFEGVIAVNNLRVWTIALGQEALSAHLTISYNDGNKRDRLLRQMQMALQQNLASQK